MQGKGGVVPWCGNIVDRPHGVPALILQIDGPLVNHAMYAYSANRDVDPILL